MGMCRALQILMEHLGCQLNKKVLFMSNNKFDWGQSVKIKGVAPKNFHPGEIVSVCGMTKIKTTFLADKYKSNIGEWIYTVEYVGGKDIEIPEKYLEKYEENEYGE